MDSALVLKIVAILLVLLSALLGGIVPRRFGVTGAGRRKLVLGNAFAGGVFLGGGLIHLLPDGISLLAAQDVGGDYPLATLIAAAAFTVVLWIEHVVAALPRAPEGHRASAAILLVVLGVHSMVAGTALGLEQSGAATVALLIAIVAHKAAAAFALGTALSAADVAGRTYARRLALFSLATPFGILVGSIAGEALTGGTAQVVEGLFDVVAAGTFLYVATMDIGAEVYGDRDRQVVKVAWSSAGLALMAVVALWV